MGGRGVGVAVGVGERVMVGVKEAVGVVVAVAVGVTATTSLPAGFNARLATPGMRRTMAAPIKISNNSKPRNPGKLRVISGMRGPWTGLAGAVGVAGVRLAPHTRQRVAFSLRRVPQFGHVFEGLVVSGLIGF